MVATLLILLVAVNAAWAAVTGLTGPILGAVGYGVILVAVARWKDSRAALVGCGVGAAWHLIKLIRPGGLVRSADGSFLIANTALAAAAVLIAASGLYASRARK